MSLFTGYVAWNNYLDVMRVDAEIEEANAETAVKVLEATAMVGAGWGPKDKVTSRTSRAGPGPGPSSQYARSSRR
jgi:hypothetical protein